MSLWYGIEAEGRLRGTPTIYVGAMDVRLNPSDLEDTPTRHIWFNPEYFLAQAFAAIDDFLAAGWQVTANLTLDLLRDSVVASMLSGYRDQPRLHVVVAMEASPGLFLLRQDDEIRLDLGYQNVLCARRRDFVHSQPRDYAPDQPIDADGHGRKVPIDRV